MAARVRSNTTDVTVGKDSAIVSPTYRDTDSICETIDGNGYRAVEGGTITDLPAIVITPTTHSAIFHDDTIGIATIREQLHREVIDTLIVITDLSRGTCLASKAARIVDADLLQPTSVGIESAFIDIRTHRAAIGVACGGESSGAIAAGSESFVVGACGTGITSTVICQTFVDVVAGEAACVVDTSKS